MRRAVLWKSVQRVLGLSDRRILVCRASRIRQKAKELHSDLPLESTFERAPGGTLVTSSWRVGKAIYTVPRSSQIAIEDMRAEYGLVIATAANAGTQITMRLPKNPPKRG